MKSPVVPKAPANSNPLQGNPPSLIPVVQPAFCNPPEIDIAVPLNPLWLYFIIISIIGPKSMLLLTPYSIPVVSLLVYLQYQVVPIPQ